MELFIQIIKSTVMAILGVVQIAMLGRSILSILFAQDGALYDFLCMITEPVIYPVRWLFDKFVPADEMVLDIPFIITFFILAIAETVLTFIG